MRTYEDWVMNETGWLDRISKGLFGKGGSSPIKQKTTYNGIPSPERGGPQAKLYDEPAATPDRSMGNMYRQANQSTPAAHPGNMYRQANQSTPAAHPSTQMPTQMTTVGFRGSDLMKFKIVLKDYGTVVSNYLSGLIHALDKIGLGNQAKELLSHFDNPSKSIISSIQWVDDLIAQKNKAGGVKESIVTEGVKVNFRSFETAKQTIFDALNGMEKFQKEIMKLLENHPRLQTNIDNYYKNKVVKQEGELVRIYDWFNKKITQLMQQNQVQQKNGQWQVPPRATPV